MNHFKNQLVLYQLFFVCLIIEASTEPLFKRAVIDFKKETPHVNTESQNINKLYEGYDGATITNVSRVVMCFNKALCRKIDHFKIPEQTLTCHDKCLKIGVHTDETRNAITNVFLPQNDLVLLEQHQNNLGPCQRIKRFDYFNF